MRRLLLLFVPLLIALPTFALSGTNLNTASKAELENLPGVGSHVADAIISARPFHSIDDLKNVPGIGEKKFAKIAPLITLDQDTGAAAKTLPTTTTASQAKEEVSTVARSVSKKTLSLTERININTASEQDLAKLPGIGPVKARSIVQGRPYATPEDLMKVKGIKEKIFAKLKDHISVH